MEPIKQLKKIKAKRIFVQFPDGLKTKIIKIADQLAKEGFEPILCLESTFGACDVRDEEAKRLGCDAILHIGHTDFGVKSKLPVVYWEYFIDLNPLPILKNNLEIFKNYKKIGLACSLQYCRALKKISNFLTRREYKVLVPKGEKYPGQILGCRQKVLSVDGKVDVWIVVSAGKFHALGLALASKKPVYNLDVEARKLYSMEQMKYKLRKIIEWNKGLLKEAKNIGILVSWKKGQLVKPYTIKESLERIGKRVYILAVDQIEPDKIEGLKLDLLINTACPRIGIDDVAKYRIPVINLSELTGFI